MEHLAERLAEIPGVVAVTLGGSRATGTAVAGSDWDFGLYYRGGIDPADIVALGWPGRVFARGRVGHHRERRGLADGRWQQGRPHLPGSRRGLALDRRRRGWPVRDSAARSATWPGSPPTFWPGNWLWAGCWPVTCPVLAFPQKLRETAPAAWSRLAAGCAVRSPVSTPRRQDSVACLANLCQAVLAAGPRPSRGRRRMGAQRKAACRTCRAGRHPGPARAARARPGRARLRRPGPSRPGRSRLGGQAGRLNGTATVMVSGNQ